VEAVNAGHLPILILRSDGSVEHIDASGPPLGILSNSDYAQTQMEMQAGDSIVMLTDGLIDARSAEGETYGVERVKKLLSRIRHLMPHEIASCVVEDVRRFQGYILSDDITIVVAKYMPSGSITNDDAHKLQHSEQ
jgi:sigma-B regulation protein RsbU (phosphoserine phosphatase)